MSDDGVPIKSRSFVRCNDRVCLHKSLSTADTIRYVAVNVYCNNNAIGGLVPCDFTTVAVTSRFRFETLHSFEFCLLLYILSTIFSLHFPVKIPVFFLFNGKKTVIFTDLLWQRFSIYGSRLNFGSHNLI